MKAPSKSSIETLLPTDPLSVTELELRESVHESFALLVLNAVVPIGVACCLIAAVVTAVIDEEQPWLLSGLLVLLSACYTGIAIWGLPRISNLKQIDYAAFAMFSGALLIDHAGSLTTRWGSTISVGLLLIVAAFAFVSNFSYTMLGIFGIGGHLLARVQAGLPLDVSQIYLLILGPFYMSISRFAVQHLERRVRTAKLGLYENIQELEREKRKRLESEKQLIHAQKMEGLGLLAAGIAHDFNNHLQSIGTFAELIHATGETKEYPLQIINTTHNAAEICRRMLAYAGRTQDEQEDFDLVQLVLDSQQMLSVGVPKPIEISFTMSEGSLMVRGNKSAMQQCLTNLVQNAVDAVQSRGGRIAVRVETVSKHPTDVTWRIFGDLSKADRLACIEVSDNGCGMSTDILECAFDPYFTTKRNGHGFGLSSTLGIVRSFGGAVRCQTGFEQGTRMQLVFPVAKPNAASEASHTNEVPATNVHSALLVDDEQSVRDSLSMLLKHNGWSVVCASTGNEALEVLRSGERQFDLLLIDYAMPDMTGIHLLETIRSESINTRAVLCSGYAEDAIFDRTGVRPDGFLTKPYRMADLLNVLGQEPV